MIVDLDAAIDLQPGFAGESGRGADAHRHDHKAGRDFAAVLQANALDLRSEEHTSELQSLMRISYAVFCLKKKKNNNKKPTSQKPTPTQHNLHISDTTKI